MTVGSNTFKGLAVPLSGESEIKQLVAATDIFTISGVSGQTGDFFVLRDSDGSEMLFVESTGQMRINATTTGAADFGFDVRQSGAGSSFQTAGNFQLTLTSAVTGGQQYALRAHFDGSCATSIGGGREACLMLYMNANSSGLGSSHSMIAVDDAASDVQAFISFINIGTSGGMIISNACGDSTHGIRVYIDSTAYYIMLTSCTE